LASAAQQEKGPKTFGKGKWIDHDKKKGKRENEE